MRSMLSCVFLKQAGREAPRGVLSVLKQFFANALLSPSSLPELISCGPINSSRKVDVEVMVKELNFLPWHESSNVGPHIKMALEHI